MTDELNNVPEEIVEEPVTPAAETEAEDNPTPDAEPVAEEPVAEEPVAEEPSDESSEDDAVLDDMAAKLQAADAERWDGLVQRFAAEEALDPADISWIGEVTGVDEALVRYGVSLQREVYKASQVDTSIADAEAEVGDLDALLSFAKTNAPEDKLSEWQTVANFASRTGDNTMTLNLLREMKQFKDSLPKNSGGKARTLAHLASAQQPTAKPETPPANEATESVETPDPLMEQLSRYSTQALAKLVTNAGADPAVAAKARAVLKTRGI